MDLIADYIEPAELTGYARDALAERQQNEFVLGRFLPNRAIDDLDYRFNRGGGGLVEAASFRNYDQPSPFGSREGVRRVTGELPPISRQLRLGEYDRLRRRAAGNDQIVEAIFNDAERLVRQIAARMELARGEVLTTGKLVLAESGVVATVDYGRAPSHTVTAGTAWTDTAAATPLTDYIAWVDAYRATNGVAPSVSVTSTKVMRLMQRNAEVIAAVAGTQTGRSRVTNAELNELLQSEGIPRIEVNDAQVKVGANARRVIGENTFTMLLEDTSLDGEGALGATLWGTTAEALEADYGIEDGEEPGIVAGTYKSANPVAIFTNAAGIGLPVAANADLSFTATVAA